MVIYSVRMRMPSQLMSGDMFGESAQSVEINVL